MQQQPNRKGEGEISVCACLTACTSACEKRETGCECVRVRVCERGGKSVAAASLPSCWYAMVVVVVVTTTRKQVEIGNFTAERMAVKS